MDFLQIIEGKKRKDKFSKPQSFYLVFFKHGQFLPVFWGFLFVCFLYFSVPSIYSLRAHQLFTGYGDLQLQFWGSHVTARGQFLALQVLLQEKSLQSEGPAIDQDPKRVKSSIPNPLVREDLFYHNVF